MRHAAFSLALLGSLAAVACGDDGTGPDGTGRIRAVITDDPGRTTAAAPAAARGAGAFSGDLSADAVVSISADGATWVDLGSPNGITVKLQDGEETDVHGEVDAPEGLYSRVRLRFSDARATLAAGGSIGGTVLTGSLDLQVGGGDREVVIERTVTPFRVEADARVTLSFELNAESWIDAEAVQTRVVQDTEVRQSTAAAVSVEVR